MAKAKNAVIAGDYNGKQVNMAFGQVSILAGIFKSVDLNKETVKTYEVVTDEQRKSLSSGLIRGLIGGAVLGPVGVAAAATAKNKGIYQVAIELKDGKRSLVEIDDKVYKALVKACFT